MDPTATAAPLASIAASMNAADVATRRCTEPGGVVRRGGREHARSDDKGALDDGRGIDILVIVADAPLVSWVQHDDHRRRCRVGRIAAVIGAGAGEAGRPGRESPAAAKLVHIHCDGRDLWQQIFSRCLDKLIDLFEHGMQRPRAEGGADGDGGGELKDLSQEGEQPRRVVCEVEAYVEGDIQDEEDNRTEEKRPEHPVLGVCRRRRRVDANTAKDEELGLEDAEVEQGRRDNRVQQ
mmetsp:Transcript_48278/g.126238  ORF Transcript_48278/g.126238 Transcript_48278/m.126238 type:complete len:237 (-) Transcript_48278:78-788(-)